MSLQFVKACTSDALTLNGILIAEDVFKEKGYEKIALTTFGFQALEFYKKLGYELEFVREDKDPKLSKFFYLKKI